MDYDIRAVFEEMELELIASMRRNLARHQRWEAKEGINWTMWQAEQLKTLEQFKKENKKIFEKKFDKVNQEIKQFLKEQYERAGFDQERLILEALTNGQGISDEIHKGLEGAFFSLNKKKMNALINATMNDMEKAEHAMLRKTNDEYRKIIYKSQTMVNSGAFTLNQCVDKASKDFLRNGIACIQYKDGRLVNIASYAEMAIRTANKRAVLVSEGEVRKAYGIHTVKISSYNQCSKICLPWQGKIYVDDVYSGGTKEEAKEKKIKTISEAMEGGLFHPNCRHRASTYFWDIEQELENYDEDGNEIDPKDQEHRRNHLKIQQQKRMETGFLDEKNQQEAKEKKEIWIEKDEKLLSVNGTEYIEDIIYHPEWFELSELDKDSYDECNRILNDLNKHMRDHHTEKSVALNYQTKEMSVDIGIKKDEVGLSKQTIQLLRKSKDNSIVLMHCHPNDTPFSFEDLLKVRDFKSVKTLIIECPSGKKYLIHRGTYKQTLFTSMNKDIFFIYDSIFDEELDNYPKIKELLQTDLIEIPKENMADWEKLLYNVNQRIANQTGLMFMEVK